MIRSLVLPVFLACAILTPRLRAQTPNEREFNQLRAERDKAAAAALEPINRRYQDGLVRLARRAAVEPDLARAIQGELQVLGGTAVAAAGAPTESATAAAPAGAPADRNTLRKIFEETEWISADGKHTFFFRRGGTFTSNGSWGKHWAVEAPGILMIYTQDPRQNRNTTFRLLRVNVAEKTAVQDLKESTEGGGLTIKYVAPAKAVK